MCETQSSLPLNQPLKGSYHPKDCLFLLKSIEADYHSIENKEALIQSGQLHYSEMIHKETPPTKEYSDLFLQMTEQYKIRLAKEVMRLAWLIAKRRTGPITLLSLARAGTPIGVLLQRALTDFYQRTSTHFSISIIRDRGIDEVALDYIIERGFEPESVVFVDGWTAKGMISQELSKAVDRYNQSRGVNVANELFVISDIGGTADVQATFDDYTIPSALMNSTVSGLVSRSILNAKIGIHDFHGCVAYQHLHQHDLSNWFVDEVTKEMHSGDLSPLCQESTPTRREVMERFLEFVMSNYAVSNINRIKPGIAEATRVLLRRVPDQLLIKQFDHVDTKHLEQLAFEKGVKVSEIADMPFGACALIKDVIK